MMWNESAGALTKLGIDDRVPRISPRYYNPSMEAKNNTKVGGGAGRGAIATLRLLNVKKGAGATKFEKRLLEEIGGADSVGMTSFLLQSVSYRDEEKSMVMQTFGDDCVVYFLGRAPRIMNFSAILLDDQVNNWFYKFMRAYDTVLRGTRVAKNFRVISITLPNANVVGTIMDLNYEQESSTDNTIRFSFSMLVRQYQPLTARVSEEYDAAPSKKTTAAFQAILDRELKTLSKADIQRKLNIPPAAGGSTLVSLGGLGSFNVNGYSKDGILMQVVDSPPDLIGVINNSSFSTMTLPYTPRAVVLSSGAGEGSAADPMQLSSPSTWDKIKKKLGDWGTNIKNFLASIESGLKSLTKMFQGWVKNIKDLVGSITSKIKSFLDPITKIINAANGMLNSVKNIVTTVQDSVDKMFQPFIQLSEDFNEMRRNFDNTLGTVINLPHTLSDKVSNNIRLVKYHGTASLGSLSAGVSSPEALSVLALTNASNSATMGVLGIGTSSVKEESRVLAL